MMVENGNKTTAFIVNPTAGRGKCYEKWKRLEEKISHRYSFEVMYTKEPGEAKAAVARLATLGFDRIFVVGGDGTINEAINGLAHSNIELGIVPLGTGNDLAKSLGIKSNLNFLESMLLHPEDLVVKKTNIATINNHYFINACGIGFDGAVAKRVNESWMMKTLGSLGYLIGALAELRTFTPMNIDVNVDGESIQVEKGWIVATSNGPYYGGGMKICPDAKIDDDLLDICIVSGLSKFNLLRFMPKVYSGKHIELKQYTTFLRGKRISIQCHGKAISHADGELIDSSHLEINLSSYIIKLLTPA